MDLRQDGVVMNKIYVAQMKDQRRTLVSTIMKLQVP
jgi:hypothetical protein